MNPPTKQTRPKVGPAGSTGAKQPAAPKGGGNQFDDGDLRKYASVKISKTKQFSLEQYESMANNLLELISSGESVGVAARALASLAYNTLIDPVADLSSRPIEASLFFHNYDSIMTEDWLQPAGESDLKLECFVELPPLAISGGGGSAKKRNQPSGKKLQLIRKKAKPIERLASIGAWAFSHLRAMVRAEEETLVAFYAPADQAGGFNRSFRNIYDCDNPYSIPALPKGAYHSLITEFNCNQPGEIRFLCFKSMIMLEKVFDHVNFKSQKRLLMELAFGPPHGLRDSGLGLFAWAESAAEVLKMPMDELFNELSWSLEHLPPVAGNTTASQEIKSLVILKEILLPKSKQASQYFRYSRLFNHQYFACLDQKQNQILIAALIEIYNTKNTKNKTIKIKAEQPNRELGQQIGRRICDKRSQSHSKSNNNNNNSSKNHPKQNNSSHSKQNPSNLNPNHKNQNNNNNNNQKQKQSNHNPNYKNQTPNHNNNNNNNSNSDNGPRGRNKNANKRQIPSTKSGLRRGSYGQHSQYGSDINLADGRRRNPDCGKCSIM